MKEYIFDILGIGSREDSYINLIAHSFKTSDDFNRNILANLLVDDYNDWIVKNRLPVAIKNITFGELKKNVDELISTATNVVDDWFS